MKYVIYYRVSTQRQGVSGLGLDAQRQSVKNFIKSDDVILNEFTEIESGRKKERPILAKAMLMAKLKNATLLIAKLDRLARSIKFITELQESKVKFIACDCPGANETMIQILAVMAEWEVKQISERIKLALAQAKLRGVKLGNPANLKTTPENRRKGIRAIKKKADEFAKSMMLIINDIKESGITSYNGIARELNNRNFATARKKEWRATTVRNLLIRYDALSNPNLIQKPAIKKSNNPQEHYKDLMEIESFRKYLDEKFPGATSQDLLRLHEIMNSNLSPNLPPILLDSNILPPILPDSNLPPPILPDSNLPPPIIPNSNKSPVLPDSNLLPPILPDSNIPPPILSDSNLPPPILTDSDLPPPILPDSNSLPPKMAHILP